MLKIKVKYLPAWWEKAKGLIGETQAYPVFFHTRWGIHTFGLKFPIDVLILDSANRVVKIVLGLPPNRILFWSPFYDRVLELPADEIIHQKITLGSTLKLDFCYTRPR